MKKFLASAAAVLLSLLAVPFSACGNGNDGPGIERTYINDKGELIIVLTDGKELNAGKTEVYEDFYYSEIVKDGQITGYSVRGIGNLSSVKLEIPSSYRGRPVTEIGEGAFLGNRYITEVKIPDSVTKIRRYAFENCESLKILDLGNGIENIGDVAFGYCTSLEAVTIPSSVRFIGSDAFSGCSALTDVNFEEGVKRMGRSVFTGCNALEEITFPESLTEIGFYYELTDGGYTTSTLTDGDFSMVGMFMNCGNLKKVRLPEKFPEIPEWFFSGCWSLQEVYLGKTVTKVGYSAFYDISNLQTIVIPKSVKEMAAFSFYKIPLLKEVFYEGSEEEWNAIKINKNNSLSSYNPETGIIDNSEAVLYFYSENKIDGVTNLWHYNNGTPEIWK